MGKFVKQGNGICSNKQWKIAAPQSTEQDGKKKQMDLPFMTNWNEAVCFKFLYHGLPLIYYCGGSDVSAGTSGGFAGKNGLGRKSKIWSLIFTKSVS